MSNRNPRTIVGPMIAHRDAIDLVGGPDPRLRLIGKGREVDAPPTDAPKTDCGCTIVRDSDSELETRTDAERRVHEREQKIRAEAARAQRARYAASVAAPRTNRLDSTGDD